MIKKIGLFQMLTRLFKYAGEILAVDEDREAVLKSSFVVVALLFSMTTMFSAYAADTPKQEKYLFSIPQQQAVHSLSHVADKAGITLIFPFEALESKTANAIDGQYTVIDALERLLRGTGYEVAVRSNGHMSIVLAKNPSGGVEVMQKINKISAAILTMAAATTFSIGVNAQETTDSGSVVLEEIVVQGYRSSLKRALDIKQNASQIVDGISAEDVGKFPDNNVAEALQRITGVAIERTNGEGQFITVRGLGPEFNTVLVNGRTIATDNDGREFSFDVLAADIISRAEVFKSSTPNLQSGGIGAVVNVSTAKPFDYDENRFSISASGTYDTLSEDTSPKISAVGSWTNDDKTLGLLLSASYDDRKAQRDSISTGGFIPASGGINGSLTDTGLTSAGNAAALPAGARRQRQLFFSREEQDRARTVLSGAFQARPNDRTEVTIDALYSSFDLEARENRFDSFIADPPILNPVVDGNGTVVSFTRPGTDFFANNPGVSGGNSTLSSIVTGISRDAESYQIGANVKFEVSETFSLEGDISSSKAERNSFTPFVVLGQSGTVAGAQNVSATSTNGVPTIAGLTRIDDPSAQRAHFVRISDDEVEDEVFEAKLNGRWEFADSKGAFKALSAGAFYNTREKLFRRNTSQDARCAFCGFFLDVPDDLLTPFQLDGFLGGVDGAGQAPAGFFDFNIDEVLGFLNSNVTSAARQNGRGFAGNPAGFAAQNASLLAVSGPQGIYTPVNQPGSNFDVDEEVVSFFLNTEFAGEFGSGMPWSANLGLRVAKTTTESTGIDRPLLSVVEAEGDSDLNFSFGPSQLVTVKNDYTSVLPSLNVKLDVADDKNVRFGISQTITRPTLTELGVNNSFDGSSTFSATSGGGNPFIEAFESTNYDLAFEWYYSDVGFFGASVFYKDFGEFIETQTLIVPQDVRRNTANGGGTESVPFEDTRSRNGETGSITGVEIAYQHTFDNLPGAWSGLGVSANYTYVDSSIDRLPGSASENCDYNGLSKSSLNASVFYENGPWQARLAYNERDEFLVLCFGQRSQPENRESFGQFDFSAQYAINDRTSIYFEGVNITDEQTRDFSIFSNRLLNFSEIGARYTLGVRAQF